MKLLLASLALVSALAAQTAPPQHSVTLTWKDGVNPSGTTYTIYRFVGSCSGAPAFTKLAAGVTALTYTDADPAMVAGNTYCYMVTATSGSNETPASNTAQATIPGTPPSDLAGTSK